MYSVWIDWRKHHVLQLQATFRSVCAITSLVHVLVDDQARLWQLKSLIRISCGVRWMSRST
jgi:hypothetical protein